MPESPVLKKYIDLIYSIIVGKPSNHGRKAVVIVWIFTVTGISQLIALLFGAGVYSVLIALIFAFISLIAYVIYPGFTYRPELVPQSEWKQWLYYLFIFACSMAICYISFCVWIVVCSA